MGSWGILASSWVEDCFTHPFSSLNICRVKTHEITLPNCLYEEGERTKDWQQAAIFRNLIHKLGICVCVCVCVYKMCTKNEYGSFLYISLFLISSLLVEKTVFSYSPQWGECNISHIPWLAYLHGTGCLGRGPQSGLWGSQHHSNVLKLEIVL